jgi:nicotinamide mononucleotide adenylyltransferase
MTNLGTVGLIGRWKPLHNAAGILLETICQSADLVKIGIGSCNKYNLRNPFTAEESREMIDLFLKPCYQNYEFIFVPDFGHILEYSDGQMWRRFVVDHYGRLDHFVTANDYVEQLLKNDYHIIHSPEIIPIQYQIPLKGSMVRMAIALGNYKQYVPSAVYEFLEQSGLTERFRGEFGLETLSLLEGDSWQAPEDLSEEKNHTHEA